MEMDLWGKLYKIVLSKLRSPPVTCLREPRKIVDMVQALFSGSSMALTILFSPVPDDGGTVLAVVPEFHAGVSPSVGSSHGWTREFFLLAVLPWWLGRSNGKVFYHHIQILTSQGYFDLFLHRICYVSSHLLYPLWGIRGDMTGSENNIAHTLVDCAAFDQEWVALIRHIGEFVPGTLFPGC